MQDCPPTRNLATRAADTAVSIQASARTMNGALPPSSREILLRLCAALAASALPTAVEPVKLIFLIEEEFNKISDISDGSPVNTCKRPSGNPALTHNSYIARAEKGVSSEGFNITGQPAAIAGANLRVIMEQGAFQGVIANTGPTGSLYTSC